MPTSQHRMRVHIKRLRRRVRLLMAERYGLFGAAAGTGAAAVLVLLSSKYNALLDWRLSYSPIAAGALIGAGYGLVRRLSDL